MFFFSRDFLRRRLKDVAGATFMALATSASEFFTSIVGVFFVKSDIACKYADGSLLLFSNEINV